MTHDIQTVQSSFGGGWAIPLSDEGRDVLLDFFGEEPTPLMPLCGEEGYIVEPYQVADLAEAITDAGLSVDKA